MVFLGLGFGGVGAAYIDGQKPWVCLLMGVAVLGLDEVLIRLRKKGE